MDKKQNTLRRYLLGTMAGGAADCSYWERNLAFQTRVHELREGMIFFVDPRFPEFKSVCDNRLIALISLITLLTDPMTHI